MPINREIGRAGIVVRWLDARDVIKLARLIRQHGNVLRDVRPGRAAVATNLHISVVRSGPQDAGNHRRLSDCDYISVTGIAVVL